METRPAGCNRCGFGWNADHVDRHFHLTPRPHGRGYLLACCDVAARVSAWMLEVGLRGSSSQPDAIAVEEPEFDILPYRR